VWSRSEFAGGSESGTNGKAKTSEGDKWAELVEMIGVAPQPSERVWVSVGDRESDVFSYFKRCSQNQWHSLVRVSQNRVITTAEQEWSYLKTYARSLAAQGQKSLLLRGRKGEAERTVTLHLAWAPVTIHPPKHSSKPQQGCISLLQISEPPTLREASYIPNPSP